MKYILTDVEGTTTSISFVHNTLFPFAKERLKAYVAKKLNDTEVKNILMQTKKTALDENHKTLTDIEAADLLIHWIDTDRKHPALKALQGMIWEEGYKSGEIKGHVYEDVPKVLEAWKKQGLIMGVYSSGSVQAQKLIFEFSTEGNLKSFFKDNFDTEIGNKKEVSSYKNIVEQLKIPVEEILFLSDIKEELDAARTVGMKTIQLVRQHNVVTGDHATAKDFSEIKI
ncbi:MAG: acireductone synthase [Bacteriovorax sp.]|nr:acireductone synthase [Bacteriovorax sp.]